MSVPVARLVCGCALCAWAVAARAAEPAPASQPPASDPAVVKRLADVDVKVEKILDYRAPFTQRKITPVLKRPLVSEGIVRARGGVTRWDTEKPHPAVMYSDTAELRLYYPEQQAMEIYPIEGDLKGLVSSPIPRLGQVQKHFAVQAAAAGDFYTSAKAGVKPPDPDPKWLGVKLKPIEPFLARHIAEVRVLIDTQSACAERVEMVDADGDLTQIVFDLSRAQLNAGLKVEDLKLDPPPGTKVSRPLEKKRGGSPGGGDGGGNAGGERR